MFVKCGETDRLSPAVTLNGLVVNRSDLNGVLLGG